MPTGYTHRVQTGEVTEFRDFAMACARAFGACITMRDDSADAPIPDEFKPSNYFRKSLDKALAHYHKVAAMTTAEAVESLAEHNAEQAKGRTSWEERNADYKRRYEAMLAKVEAWTPPTADHEELKRFMVSQLTESIKFDCHDGDFAERCCPSFNGTAADWLAHLRNKAAEDVAYRKKAWDDEVERCRRRTKWVSDFRASLS